MSAPFRIRDYRLEDFPAIEVLWKAVGMAAPQRGDTAEVIERSLRIENARLLVLEKTADESVAGTVWLTCDGRRLLLHHFAVEPSLQGRGLSKILLQASLDHARAAGLQVKLEVARGNTHAVELYKNAGFTSLGDYEVYILRDLRRG